MFTNQPRFEIQKDPSRKVHSINVIPIQMEKEMMRLKPEREAIFHGDCVLICHEGEAEIINPLSGTITLIDDVDNKTNRVKKYYVDGIIFGIKADKKGVKFSIQRQSKWK